MILNKMTFSRIKLLFESSCLKFLLKLWVVVYLRLIKILFICDCLSFEIRFYGRSHSCFCNQGSAAARQPCVSLSKIVILQLENFRWISETCSYKSIHLFAKGIYWHTSGFKCESYARLPSPFCNNICNFAIQVCIKI